MATDCCSAPDAAPDTSLPDPADLQNDPALLDCCARDLKQQRYVARVKAQLTAVDRTLERQKVHGQVLDQAPASPEPSWAGDSDQEELSDSTGACTAHGPWGKWSPCQAWLWHCRYSRGLPAIEASRAAGCSKAATQLAWPAGLHRQHPSGAVAWRRRGVRSDRTDNMAELADQQESIRHAEAAVCHLAGRPSQVQSAASHRLQ